MTPIRLMVGASASSKDLLLEQLRDLAVQFFGDEPCRLVGSVSAEAEVEVSTLQGFSQVTIWSGQAVFTNLEAG